MRGSEWCMVRISTLVGEPLAVICRAASKPLREGMLMSRMLTSGLSCFAFSTASFPLVASPGGREGLDARYRDHLLPTLPAWPFLPPAQRVAMLRQIPYRRPYTE